MVRTLPGAPTATGDVAATDEVAALTAPGTRRTLTEPAALPRTEVAETVVVPSTEPPSRVKEIAPAVAIDPSVVATVYASPFKTAFENASCSPEALTARVATPSAATESGDAVSAIAPDGAPEPRVIPTEPEALPRSETTLMLAGPAAVPARTQPESVPSAAAVHWNPGVPGSASVITVTPEPVTVKRSPAATTLANASWTASDVTCEESTPSAVRDPGVAVSAITPAG